MDNFYRVIRDDRGQYNMGTVSKPLEEESHALVYAIQNCWVKG